MARRSSCDRVRHWAALAPDGVLSQIEQRLLEAHVERCESCRTFADGVAGIAAMLRTAALEERERTVPFRASRRRPRFSFVRGVTSAAATIAVTTIAVSTIVAFATSSDRSAPIGRPAIVIDATSVDSDVERNGFLRGLRDYSHARNLGEVQYLRSQGPGLIAG
jgi:predicted anti-sigma-YlaC factor YlaD